MAALGDDGEAEKAALPDHIYMDAMGFGMGCCCLQLTFQVGINVSTDLCLTGMWQYKNDAGSFSDSQGLKYIFSIILKWSIVGLVWRAIHLIFGLISVYHCNFYQLLVSLVLIAHDQMAVAQDKTDGNWWSKLRI